MAGNPNIQHIVVLMMENRSFDHILGFMKRENVDIDGVVGDDYSNRDTSGEPQPVTDGAIYQGQLIMDPGHDVDDVFFQMYGVPFGSPAGDVNMSGFAQNYEQQGGNPSDIMRCFRPAQLPNTTALAREYAVCDRWFSSVPGPTLPNRAFVHFGTSFGRLDMSPIYFSKNPSIYQRVTAAGGSAKIYYYANWSGTMGLTFLVSDQPKYFGLWGDFQSDCNNNRLPQYSFIEPAYYDNGETIAADQHPDHNVQAGDEFVRQVYEAIRRNEAVWRSTLFLIVWDEHGGVFDHVPPPVVPLQNRDGYTSVAPPFNFDHYGVRVPAIAISPYIPAGTVNHTLFEHASIPATVTEQFIGDPQAKSLFNREKFSNTLLSLLTLAAPREDAPNFNAAPAAAVLPSGKNYAAQLHLDQVKEVHTALKATDPGLASQMDPASVQTEADASQFVAKAMASINPRAALPAERSSREDESQGVCADSRRCDGGSRILCRNRLRSCGGLEERQLGQDRPSLLVR